MKVHFDVNTLGPLRTVTALEPLLKKGSKVGIVSSRVGSIDDNTSSNNYAYRVSKTAVNMVGKCLSIDLAPKGIALALLHPGYVKTDMTKYSGLISAQESASGLIQRMDELGISTTGIFVHTSGEVLTW
jgi:NAD(P)-dependent dehydrogenase (short-subunit alcohol dehydrogenase family)